MRHTLCTLLMACCTSYAAGQTAHSFQLKGETRMSYQYQSIDGTRQNENTGFKGEYLCLLLDGTLTPQFRYSWKQRLNKMHANQSFFDATDWLELTYQASPHWEISGGKQVVAIGGYEYDRNPIDVYISSEFWNGINCYQFGASLAYLWSSHKLLAQFSESPFQQPDDRNLYAYSLMWAGQWGHLSTLYSLNLIEFLPRHYISYLALGHHIEAGPCTLELDWMNRAGGHQTFLFRDCSMMANLEYRCSPRLSLMAKLTYDVNRSHTPADLCVLPGTELTTISGGVEYFPILGGQDVRLHGVVGYSTGRNGDAPGCVHDHQLQVNVGVTWRMSFIEKNRRL